VYSRVHFTLQTIGIFAPFQILKKPPKSARPLITCRFAANSSTWQSPAFAQLHKHQQMAKNGQSGHLPFSRFWQNLFAAHRC